MMIGYFDTIAFITALDAVRETRGLTWNGVFRETGIADTTLRNLRGERTRHTKKPYCPNADTVAMLIVWSGLDANIFIKLKEGGHENLDE